MKQKLYAIYVWLGHVFYWLSSPLRWVILSHTLRGYAIIEHDSRVLFVKNWLGAGEWSLPGGGIHSWEHAEDGVRRELHEEIGIDLAPTELHFEHEGFHKDTFGGKRYVIYSARLSVEPTIVRRGLEIIDYQWIPRTTLESMENLSPVARAALKL